ncbi:cytochrome p450, partial [Colletotrichum scovillei]
MFSERGVNSTLNGSGRGAGLLLKAKISTEKGRIEKSRKDELRKNEAYNRTCSSTDRIRNAQSSSTIVNHMPCSASGCPLHTRLPQPNVK